MALGMHRSPAVSYPVEPPLGRMVFKVIGVESGQGPYTTLTAGRAARPLLVGGECGVLDQRMNCLKLERVKRL